ncbi:hypothetical protein BKP42_58520 [Rhodococcus erythropolis]|nr:hypothetical protein BKP42_58520 [Rhodococcus erythropolis]
MNTAPVLTRLPVTAGANASTISDVSMCTVVCHPTAIGVAR